MTAAPDVGSPASGVSAFVHGGALARRFRFEHVIGMGSMGIVIAAHHLTLDVRVAIKLMRPELRERKHVVGRFMREAQAAARLTSRHAVRVLDVDTLEDGAPYIVMEYLDGVDLATQLRTHGPVSAARAAEIVLQACHALGEAHQHGIIHRDLKPANLFAARGQDGEALIKVLDLGVCRFDSQAEILGDTSSSAIVGTPVYMAPEQLRASHGADARSDIWSLGVILYALVTGHVPFRGRGVADQCARAMLDPCPAIGRPDVPRAFEAVVARCLAKDPAARFQHMAALAGALQPLCTGRGRGRRSLRHAAVAAAVAAALAAAMVWVPGAQAPVPRRGVAPRVTGAAIEAVPEAVPEVPPPVIAAPSAIATPPPIAVPPSPHAGHAPRTAPAAVAVFDPLATPS